MTCNSFISVFGKAYIKTRGGGVRQCDFFFGFLLLYFLSLFKGSFGLFNAYLIVIGLFLPRTEDKKNIVLKINIFFRNVDKGWRGWGSADVDNNYILKSAGVDLSSYKRGGRV